MKQTCKAWRTKDSLNPEVNISLNFENVNVEELFFKKAFHLGKIINLEVVLIQFSTKNSQKISDGKFSPEGISTALDQIKSKAKHILVFWYNDDKDISSKDELLSLIFEEIKEQLNKESKDSEKIFEPRQSGSGGVVTID